MKKIKLLGTQNQFVNDMNEICMTTRSKINFKPCDAVQECMNKCCIVGYKTAFGNYVITLPMNWYHFKLDGMKNMSYIVDNQARLRFCINHKTKFIEICRRYDYRVKSFRYAELKYPRSFVYVTDGGRECHQEEVDQAKVKELYMKAGRDLDKLSQLVFDDYESRMDRDLPDWKDYDAYWEI